MEKDTKQPEQNIDILDILLDEDNEDPITLYDENSKAIRCNYPIRRKIICYFKTYWWN